MADERAVHPVGEESGVRWEETWTAGDLLLLTGYGPGGPRARAYDARTGDPAGPLLDTPPLSLLLDTPGGDPSVAHAEGHDLVLRDHLAPGRAGLGIHRRDRPTETER